MTDPQGIPTRVPWVSFTIACIVTGGLAVWIGITAYQSFELPEVAEGRAMRMEQLRGMVIHLDEVLTMSANMAAATGDPGWEERYRRFEPQLDAAIKEALTLVPRSDQVAAVRQTDLANTKLVEMEHRAFALVRSGRLDEARTILFGGEYQTQKKVYREGIEHAMTKIESELDATLQDEKRTKFLFVGGAAMVFVVFLLAWLLVLRYRLRWHADLLRTMTERQEAERALCDSEATKQAMAEAIPDLLFRIRRDGTYLDFNAAKGLKPFLSPRQFLGKTVQDLMPPDIVLSSMEAIERAIATGEMQQIEYQLLLDDDVREYEARLVVSGPDEVLAIVRDVTEQKQAAEQRQRSHRTVQLLAEFNELTSGRRVQDVAHETLSFIEEKLGFHHGTIALLLPDRKGFRILEARHHDATGFDEGVIIPMEGSPLLEVIGRLQPLYRPDIAAAQSGCAVNRTLLAAGLQSDFLVPLWSENKCIGTLNMAAPCRDGFTEADRECLTLMAPRLAQAIDQAMLFQQLQESSQFNQQIIANAREGIIVYDRDLRYTVWNPFMEELTGLRAEKVLGKRPRDLPSIYQEEHGKLVMEQATMEGIEASIQRAMAGETFSFMDISFVVQHTGMKGWTSVRYGPFRNAQGEIIGVIATVREITDRKRAEEALRDSEERFRRLSEAAAEGIVIAEKGNILEVNETYATMFGYHPSDVVGMQVLEFITPEYRALVKERMLSGYEKSYEVVGLRKDGSTFPLEARGKSMPYRGRMVRVTVIRDITERQRVAESVTKLSSAVEQAADSVFITNREGVIEYVNPAFEQLVGYSKAEAVGQNARLLKSGQHTERFYQILWQTILSGKIFRAVLINRKKSGEIYYEEKSITPIKDKEGQITHFISTGHDITERKRADEVQARLAAILEATTDFVGTTDASGRLLYLNQAGRALLGIAQEEPVSTLQIADCHPIWASVLIMNEGIPKAILHGVWSGETALLTRDGREIPLSQVILAHKSGDGTVTYLSTIARDISERKAQTAALEYQATHDSLTDLPNRNLLHDRLQQAILAAQRDHHPLALLVLDLDRFKEINDTLGHHHGDLLLKEVGPRLRGALRESDTIARLGGDEFAVLLPTADRDGALLAAQKILESLAHPFTLDELVLDIEASIGIALFPEHGVDADTILRRADVAMYMAKQAGSGFALYASEHDQHSHRRLSLMGELRYAIERDQLFLVYQPTVNLRTGRVVGGEALLRWQHPKHGLIPPVQFIPLSEQTGLIKPLTDLVLNTALRQCRAWHQAGLKLNIAVNLSARSLHDPNFPDQMERVLAANGVAPQSLELELTESAIMADPDRAMEILSCLSIMGIRLAIDDFGVGHSSLTYLKRLPIHEIKIDKSFVINMVSDPDDAMIVRSIIDLGHGQGLKIIAEGVENQQTIDRLIDLGCDAVQGTYLSRPIPAEEFVLWAHESPWSVSRG